jgi:predicted 2-oxoglutarate/Fe(II)-dependent dioxygenase YbiX
MEENFLSNIIIKEKVLTEDAINFLINFVSSKQKKDLCVFDPDKSNKTGNIESSIEKNVRDTQWVDYTEIHDLVYDLYKDIVKNIINPFYNIEVKDSEMPQFLHYGVGGHYKPHNDAEALWKAPNGDVFWRKSMDRDLSTVLFLNDDFEGGDFVFPELNIYVKPKPGLLICFPSDHRYIHGVEPVTKGTRYSIVNWMRVKGVKTVEEQTEEINLKYGIKS